MSTAQETTPALKRFTKIGADGKPLPFEATIDDHWEVNASAETGLMWVVWKKDLIRVPNWREPQVKKAREAVAKMRFGGFDDWRLPVRRELLTPVDDTRFNPAIDTEFFPDCPSDWFWSDTNYAPVEGYAWLVHFDDGYAYGGSRNDNGFVRAVRGGQ
ncbi:MAG TPA: DUF1566 domain-containing protein [Gammaproteobacteria bacterium]|nr:DUF1566 domain-containing protein [Gammaproteobacteria bacterium]